MENNYQRLGAVLAGRMSKTSKAAVPMSVEFGTIGWGMALTTDSIGDQIPRGDYMINAELAGKLKAGDRVLVVWSGNEPVVVSTIVSS